MTEALRSECQAKELDLQLMGTLITSVTETTDGQVKREEVSPSEGILQDSKTPAVSGKEGRPAGG